MQLLREYIREILKEEREYPMAPGSENALSKVNKMSFNTDDGWQTFWLPRGAKENDASGYVPSEESIIWTEFDLTKEEFTNGYKPRQLESDWHRSYGKQQKDHMIKSFESDPDVEVIEHNGSNYYRVKTDGPPGVTNGKYDGTEPPTKEQLAAMTLEDKILHAYFYNYDVNIWAVKDANVFDRDQFFDMYYRPERQKPTDEKLLPTRTWAVDEVKEFRELFGPLEQRLGRKKLEKLMDSVAKKADRVIDQIPEAEDLLDEKFVQRAFDIATSRLSDISRLGREALGDGDVTAGISRAIFFDDSTESMKGKWPLYIKLLELIESAPKITFANDKEVLDAFPAFVEKMVKISYYDDLVSAIGRAWKKADPATYKQGYAKLRKALKGNRDVGTVIRRPEHLYEPIYNDGRYWTSEPLPDAVRIQFVRDNINK